LTKLANNPFPVEVKQLLKSGILLYQMIFQEKLDYEELFEKNQHIISPLLAAKPIEMEMIPIREESKFHKTYLSEKYLGECVIRGDVAELKKAFSNYMNKGTAGKLSNNSMRHKKNILISVITMTTRSAIQGGLPEEEAFLMSDLYIQELEELTELEEIRTLAYNVMIDFADKVKQHRYCQVSYKILSCQKYIVNHLYEKLSVSEIAEELHMNISYLSSQFKKETGQTITNFIQEKRIEEARELILFSDYPFSRIYTLLNFTDQSHFIKIFKKYTGITPKKFQDQYIYHASTSIYD
jgi:AraC-like DNA-binding protein